MDLALTPAQQELQARVRSFVVEVLQPLEGPFEARGGRLEPDELAEIKRRAIAANLHGGSFPVEVGGQGWTALEGVLVHEQLGQVTGGLWGFIPGAYNALIHCDAEQRRR